MLAVVISGVMVLLFIGILSYRWIMPGLTARKGRQVDVKVLSCMQKELPRRSGWKETMYYEVVVEFYDLNGESIVRSLQSKTPYIQGDVIRCRYLDKKDFLLPEMASGIQTGARNGLLLLLVFFLVFVWMMASVLWGMKSGEKREISFGWSSASAEEAYYRQ